MTTIDDILELVRKGAELSDQEIRDLADEVIRMRNNRGWVRESVVRQEKSLDYPIMVE